MTTPRSNPDECDEAIVDTIQRLGGSRLEVLVLRRKSDARTTIAIRAWSRAGRRFTLSIFAHEGPRLAAALAEAMRILNEVASMPIASSASGSAPTADRNH